MTKKKNIFMALIAVSVIGIASTVGILSHTGTFAKYTGEESGSVSTQLYSFKAQPLAEYTSDSGKTITVSEDDLKDNNGVLRLSLSEYATLKCSVKYSGEGKAYVRLKLSESWQHERDDGTEMLTPKQLSVYTLDKKVFDNRSDDSYLYYKEPLSMTDAASEVTLLMITKCKAGLDAQDLLSSDDKSTFVDISISVEAVQFNRLSVWNIDKELLEG